jgi:hypothetical protein
MTAAAVPALSHAGAADSLRVDTPRENALHPGMWALMFQIDEDIVPKPFDGMGIALKRHMSRKGALRLGFDIGLSVDENDAESWKMLDDTLRNDQEDYSRNEGQSIAFELLYLMYPWPDSYINFFWALGPTFTFGRSEQERGIIYDMDSGNYYQSYYSRTWTAGLKGVAGVEWFATRRISFHMEYQATIAYLSRYTEMEKTDEYYPSEEARTIDSGEWRLSVGRVVVGISMYF